MKAAVLLPSPAPPKAILQVQDVPARQPGKGEVLVALRAAALNRRDVWIRLGKYAGIKLPCIPGSDGAGVVSAVGEGAPAGLLGAEVLLNPGLDWGPDPAVQGAGFRILGMPDDGTHAEQICIAAAQVLRKPAHLSFAEAAALPLAGLTGYRALRRGRLRPGETVLVPGIGGGVSTMVLLLSRHLGARVLVTSGSADKLRRALELGAEFGVDHRDPDWDKQLVARCGAPDLAIDGAGGDTFARCLAAVRPGGRVVSYGATTGPANFEVRRLFFKQLDVLGSTMGTAEDFRELLALVGAGQLRPLVDTVLPLAEAAAAYDRMEKGEQMGKIVLKIG